VTKIISRSLLVLPASVACGI